MPRPTPFHPPHPAPRLLLWSATAAAVLLLAGCAAWKVNTAKDLAKASEPLQRSVAAPSARLLIVGDSTAVGTGASSPATSLAGLLANTYPGLNIENRAKDGATVADLPAQLDGAGRVDIVLIQAGGNDVIKLHSLDSVRMDLDRTVRLAREKAQHVVLMPSGNVGNAPFFFPPVSWLMTSRSRDLHTIVRETAAREGVVYVNLFKEKADDPFVKKPELNARDGLHPSDAGYRVWYEELQTQSGSLWNDAGRRTAAAH